MFRFVIVEAVVDVAQFDVECGTLLLPGRQFQRMEYGGSLFHVGKVSGLSVHIDQ